MKRRLYRLWFIVRHPLFYWRIMRKRRWLRKEAGAAYLEGVKPYLETLEKLELPPRGAVGCDDNFRRAWLVAKALHDKKVELEKKEEAK